MRYQLTQAQQAFKSEVETFLAEHLPGDLAEKCVKVRAYPKLIWLIGPES